jgi:hypothetical protein
MVEESLNFEDSIVNVKEPDQFSYQKQEGFSHQLSVQKAYYKVVDNLNVEMVEGFWQELKDKHGNVKLIHQTDTREQAIESVETLKNVMIADLQQTTNHNKINELLKSIETLKQTCLNEQKSWWKGIGYDGQIEYQNKHLSFDPNHLYDKLCYWHEFRNQTVKIYRQIFEQLELCLSGIKYFKKGMYTNLAEPLTTDQIEKYG